MFRYDLSPITLFQSSIMISTYLLKNPKQIGVRYTSQGRSKTLIKNWPKYFSTSSLVQSASLSHALA
jgi:hypothetical protein